LAVHPATDHEDPRHLRFRGGPARIRRLLVWPAGVLPGADGYIRHNRLTPYDVPRRGGEFKLLIITEPPDGDIMLRLVLRSDQLVRLIPAFSQN
jgi:hypothetical protein